MQEYVAGVVVVVVGGRSGGGGGWLEMKIERRIAKKNFGTSRAKTWVINRDEQVRQQRQ